MKTYQNHGKTQQDIASPDSLWLPSGWPWAPLWRPGALVGPLVGSWGAFGSLCLCLGCLCRLPLGSLCLPLGCLCWVPLGFLDLPLGCLWLPVAVLWPPFGSPWHPLGQLQDFLKNKLHCCEQMCQNHCKTQQDIVSANSPAGSAGSAGSTGSAVMKS